MGHAASFAGFPNRQVEIKTGFTFAPFNHRQAYKRPKAIYFIERRIVPLHPAISSIKGSELGITFLAKIYLEVTL
jgi:hypothetical protein